MLAQSIARDGFQKVTNGANPNEVRTGVHKAVSMVIDSLKQLSKPVTTPEEIAQVMNNCDLDLGYLIDIRYHTVLVLAYLIRTLKKYGHLYNQDTLWSPI